jgi:hypothetical protein
MAPNAAFARWGGESGGTAAAAQCRLFALTFRRVKVQNVGWGLTIGSTFLRGCCASRRDFCCDFQGGPQRCVQKSNILHGRRCGRRRKRRCVVMRAWFKSRGVLLFVMGMGRLVAGVAAPKREGGQGGQGGQVAELSSFHCSAFGSSGCRLEWAGAVGRVGLTLRVRRSSHGV